MDVDALLDGLDAPKKRLLTALIDAKGIVTTACEACQMPRSTFYVWMKADEQFKAAVEDIQDVAIDYVEGKLFNLIEKEDTAATIFFMKTRGKKRGYVERTELTGENGGPVQNTLQVKIIRDKGNEPAPGNASPESAESN